MPKDGNLTSIGPKGFAPRLKQVIIMQKQDIRTAMLLGENGVAKLKNSRVAIFGIGGVGGHAAEALARAGVGTIDLFDGDVVSESNINRQLIALHSTVGLHKAEVMKARIADICPQTQVHAHNVFYTEENAENYPLTDYDYIIDAVDMVSAKLLLAVGANAQNVSIISCMGAGNKLDPTAFRVTDIYKTTMCPLAKVMRRELKARGIRKLKVVFSTEPPITPLAMEDDKTLAPQKRQAPGSVSFVPSVAGLILAGEVIKDLIK